MNKKYKHALALSLASIGALGALASVSADTLSTTNSTDVTSTTSTNSTPNNRPPRADDTVHSAIKLAITNGDYQAFLTAVKTAEAKRPSDAPAMPTITEAQFQVIVAAQKLETSGDTTGAKTLLDNAGIKFPLGMHGGHGPDDTFANLTDAQKTAMSQARTLFEAGKQDEAKATLTAAGITMPEHGRHDGANDTQRKAFEATLTDAQKVTLKQSFELMRSGKKDEADALLKTAGITLPTPPARLTNTQTTTTN